MERLRKIYKETDRQKDRDREKNVANSRVKEIETLRKNQTARATWRELE